MSSSRSPLFLRLAITATLLVGCADVTEPGPPEPDPTANGTPEEEDAGDVDLDGELPPVDPLALEPLYGEALAELGVELTDRGGLIDRTDGYEVSPDGTHLALYVSPTGERTDEDYIDGVVELAQMFLMDVFDRWSGLESFDVCQELPGDEVEEGYVPTVTQIDITREVAAELDWSEVDLVDLFEIDRERDEAVVRMIGDLVHNDRVVDAREAAIARIDARLHGEE